MRFSIASTGRQFKLTNIDIDNYSNFKPTSNYNVLAILYEPVHDNDYTYFGVVNARGYFEWVKSDLCEIVKA